MATVLLDSVVVRKLNAQHRCRAVTQRAVRGTVSLALGSGFVWLLANGYWRLALLILLSGGLGLAYAAGRLIGDWNLLGRGLLVRPREPWALKLVGLDLEVRVGRRVYSVPLEQVRGATLIFEGAFESVSTLVDALVLHLVDLPDLAVPETAQGCAAVILALDARGLLSRVNVEA